MKITGKKILITGGTSGIGLEFARQLRINNRVIVMGRNVDRLKHVKEMYSDVDTVQGDISSISDIMRISQEYPDIDILINNAGIAKRIDLFEKTTDTTTEVISVNLLGTINMTQAFLPSLALKKETMIVNVTSAVANIAVTDDPFYSASKAGIHMFTDSLREQVRKRKLNIHVIELVPPLVRDTGMTGNQKMSFSITTEKLVADALKGMKKNKRRINVGNTKTLRFGSKIFPDYLTRQFAKFG